MKSKFFNPFVCIAGFVALLFLQGCDGISDLFKEPASLSSPKVRNIDMTVVIPIHPSSLEYFYYCICYTDNTGEEYCDTVSNSKASLYNEFYWLKTYQYKLMPVVDRCEVTIIPKVSRDSVISFSYIIPKPRIYPNVFYDSGPTFLHNEEYDNESLGIMNFDRVRIGSFMSAYGSYFCSTCRVKEDYDGITYSFN